MKEIKSNEEAFVAALYLSVTADIDDESKACQRIAHTVGLKMTKKSVELCVMATEVILDMQR